MNQYRVLTKVFVTTPERGSHLYKPGDTITTSADLDELCREYSDGRYKVVNVTDQVDRRGRVHNPAPASKLKKL